MKKTTKKIIRSLLLTSALLLINTNVKAQNPLMPDFDLEDDEIDEVGEIKHKIFKKVVKISPKGRMTMVDSHRSHSSHRSHYSGSGGHSSHSSHYSSSHTSHYSSSKPTPLYNTPSKPKPSSTPSTKPTTPSNTRPQSTPKVKTPSDYSLGERAITSGIYGLDIDELVKLLTAAGYPPNSTKLEYQSGHLIFNDEIAMAVKMFQAYNQLETTGIPDTKTIQKLKKFKK
jgi:hypothetical protein